MENGNLKKSLPYPADQMRIWEISPRINSAENDDPTLWKPHAEATKTTTDALETVREGKPSNIMVSSEKRGEVTAKIIDLGLAKGDEAARESAISAPGGSPGTLKGMELY